MATPAPTPAPTPASTPVPVTISPEPPPDASASSSPEKQDQIDMTCSFMPSVIGSKRIATFSITNLGEKIGKTLLSIKSKYWRARTVELGIINALETKEHKVEFDAIGSASILSLEETFVITLKSEVSGWFGKSTLMTRTYTFRECMSYFSPVATLKAKYPVLEKVNEVNIHIVGQHGSGKSSLVNSFFTALSTKQDVVVAKAGTGGGSVHNTTFLSVYPIPDTPFKIYDCWGVTPSSYYFEELLSLLNGEFPLGWSIDDNQQKRKFSPGWAIRKEEEKPYIPLMKARIGLKTKHERCAHAIIFTVAAGALDSEETKKLAMHARKLVNKELCPLLFLTLADTQVPEEGFRKNPLKETKEIKRLIKRAGEVFSIESSRIFPCVSYLQEKTRFFELDRYLLHLLDKVLSASDDRLSTPRPTCAPSDEEEIRKMKEELAKAEEAALQTDAYASVLTAKDEKFRLKHLSSKEAKEWTVDEVSTWLASLQLTKHQEAFQRNRVDGELLLTITDVVLHELGVESSVERLRILNQVKKLEEDELEE